MRKLGLAAPIRRKRKGCTKTDYSNYEKNILDRDFTAKALNQKWVTDVTYLEYGLVQKVYLSAIKDLYDGGIVSFEIGKHNDNPLVMQTLEKSFKTLNGDDLLLHSDRGAQYTSKEYVRMTSDYAVRRSMSRVAKCLDNVPCVNYDFTCCYFEMPRNIFLSLRMPLLCHLKHWGKATVKTYIILVVCKISIIAFLSTK